LELTPVAHPHDAKHDRPTWAAKLVGRGFEGSANAGQFLGLEKEVADGMVAEMICPESPYEDQLLHAYFDDLYAERNGWDGEKTWVSQFEHLRFVATHDYVNTVTLTIEVRGISDPPWLASATLPVDPGLFHRIGANAKIFGDRQMAGEVQTADS